jgi:hypothetical protein
MNRIAADLSNFDRTIYAVFGTSLGLVALAVRGKPLLRAVALVAGAALLLRASVGPTASDDTSHSSLDDALADSFPASDPPASRMADEPASNAAAKWEAHRNSTVGSEDTPEDIEGK